nr:immunoglobulin heavy chain junction region [Macaca mulatta]MOX92292.1 immunoglobulin heavy chain junction region [Macaca mulatta]MOX92330.1 immunoglobulin heavy chain junction region [Macaca mulatta]MOX92405.1 immunoglobulin heavy chain junction region [Macaca mulatta]MOX93049.1 immunoglobulin heavy chain junction region [Macaca mulatta]
CATNPLCRGSYCSRMRW